MGIFEVIIVGIIAGSATAIGGLLSVIIPVKKDYWLALTFGFAGGVMVGLSLFQLMPEGYFFANSIFPTGFGFAVGIISMALLSYLTGTIDSKDSFEQNNFRKTGLFICLALALHNFPEGIAVGVGFAGAGSLGFMIAFAMLLHNIPEGLGIGVPLRKSGMKLGYILLLTAAAGLVTPLGAAIGWCFGNISMAALGWAMGLAAGAMVFVSFTKLLSFRGFFNNLGAFCGLLLTFIIA